MKFDNILDMHGIHYHMDCGLAGPECEKYEPVCPLALRGYSYMPFTAKKGGVGKPR